MIDRRSFTLATGAALLFPATAGGRRRAGTSPAARLAAVERAAGGRLGVFMLDTGSGRSVGWRADERFCHCSTFKFSLAAMVLHEGDAGRLDLHEVLRFGKADVMDNSPVVQANVAMGGLPIVDLAEAIQVRSDNTAANLLMRRLGGPEALTRFWRTIGDATSRVDDYEPEVNVIPPGTDKNSTTPRAMAANLDRIVLGDVLRRDSRDRLRGWMAATRTGVHRLRAGLPAGWGVMDRTGTGGRPGIGNKTNDIAVLMPPGGRAPLIVTSYYESATFADDILPRDEAVLSKVATIAATWWGQHATDRSS